MKLIFVLPSVWCKVGAVKDKQRLCAQYCTHKLNSYNDNSFFRVVILGGVNIMKT